MSSFHRAAASVPPLRAIQQHIDPSRPQDPQTLSADAAQAAEGSTLVITSTDKSETAECRICKGGTEEGRLVRACRCRAYVHVSCLQRWLQHRPADSRVSAARGQGLASGTADASLPQCEVCRAPYNLRISHRSYFDFQRCCSVRSCESYFECVSLLVTLTTLIVTPWLVWKASSALERQAILTQWPLLLITLTFMVLLSIAALRKMYCRWRRSQTITLITLEV